MTLHFFDYKIKLSYPLVCSLTAILIIDTTGTALISCVSAFIHECGHIAVLSYYNANTKYIGLSLFDANIKSANTKITLNQEIIVSLAGPATNLIISTLSFALLIFFSYNGIKTFAYANLLLFLFNILPVDSLDGGNAVFLIISKFTTIYSASKILEIISFVILIPIYILGFYLFINTGYNFTLLLLSIYLTATLLLKKAKCKIGG